MIDSIAKITLYVNNQEEAKLFWVEKMNFVVRYEQQMGLDMKWIEVSPSDKSATVFVLYNKKMMMTQNPDTNVGHPSVILSTHNIEMTHTTLKEKGVEIGEIINMPYGRMFDFSDMDGNKFLLREDKLY